MLDYIAYAFPYLFWAIGSLFRRMGRPPGYVTFTLEGAYPTLPQPRPNWIMRRFQPFKVSWAEIAEYFRQIAGDPRVRGVVLNFHGLALGPAQADMLRDMIATLRAAGKRVVTWAHSYDSTTYYVACAADEILVIPSGGLEPLGEARRYIFLADLLARIGLKAEFVQVSPYKSAGDMFTRSEMSNEVREMANWLIDSAYEQLVKAVAAGRELDEQAAKALVDRTPCTDLQAKEICAVDGIMDQEELPAHLGQGDRPARLGSWGQARARLRRPAPRRPGKYVALMEVRGDIVPGYSQRPPMRPPFSLPFVTDERAGDLSVVGTARRILADRQAAAVVVYVDSRGGSATASEAMRSALAQLAEKKPLVIAMGTYAASGGYWISTPGRVLMAQPSTLTGSIGVLSGKVTDAGFLEKLRINTEEVSRGEHALLYDPLHPLGPEGKEILAAHIQRDYGMFLELVSASRKMPVEQVDAIGAGRVWTGRQAVENGLVDELGGLEQAFARARELGGLDKRAPVRLVHPEHRPSVPPSTPGAFVLYALEGVRMLQRARVLALWPVHVSIET